MLYYCVLQRSFFPKRLSSFDEITRGVHIIIHHNVPFGQQLQIRRDLRARTLFGIGWEFVSRTPWVKRSMYQTSNNTN